MNLQKPWIEADAVYLAQVYGSAREVDHGDVKVENLEAKLSKRSAIIAAENVSPLLDHDNAVYVFMGTGDVKPMNTHLSVYYLVWHIVYNKRWLSLESVGSRLKFICPLKEYGDEESRMMIRSITPADQEQLLLLEEKLHNNKGRGTGATLEGSAGFEEAISLLTEQAGDAVAYLLATEDQPLKRRPNCIATSGEAAFQGQGWLLFWSLL